VLITNSLFNGITKPCVDGVFDLDDSTSEIAFTTDRDVLRVGPIELVMGGHADGGNMFVGEGEDPVAGVAIAGLHPPEQEHEGASSDCLATGMPRPVLKGRLRLNLGLVLFSTLIRGGPASLLTDSLYHLMTTSVIWVSARM